METQQLARKAISLLDLTNLNDICDDAAIEDLCARAQTPYGNTAAVCVWPRFVKKAKECLAGTGIKIATVVNFPQGGEDLEPVLAETTVALADGADEIDLVISYKAFMAGRKGFAENMIAKVKAAIPAPAKLKTILETGELKEPELIRQASIMAIDAGADFIKTSTGKVAVNATPEAADIMLSVIAESDSPVGFKPAGGVKTLEDAGTYLAIAEKYMGAEWASPESFRFGASGVLDALLAAMEGQQAEAKEGY
ncbi:deoxyribose-phosphate aldolase [uncultured Cohaesibacter sp.]|uniref:deoxyribose-phosphate aldolase n=1 Tax=uncultured Cohaesibacter sp. TaxID=1002546 RepID=UPI0029302A31|nr:deoxyribose-phosphate aldolase [uncultured Cohaesibacter sp.]